MRRHYESSGWADKSLKDCLRSNYSLLDILLGRWRYKPSHIRCDMIACMDLHTQRHQTKSRFL